MKPSFRTRVRLEEHHRIAMSDPAILREPVTNIIYDPGDAPEKQWIGRMTEKLGDWRAVSRSAYIRWALILNAAHVSEGYYEALPKDRALIVHAARGKDGKLYQTPMKQYDGSTAAGAYREIIPTIAGYAIADLYGVLEEIIFDAYEIFLSHSPAPLMEGAEYRDLRRLHARRNESEGDREAWETAWSQRFDQWRRKRTYDPLHRVFVGFFNTAALKRPSEYVLTDLADWARTIETIAELRHLLTHGEGTVNAKLAELCASDPSLVWIFKEGEELKPTLLHLQAVEYFIEQLLTTLNTSLVEKGWGRTMKSIRKNFEAQDKAARAAAQAKPATPAE